MRKLLLSLPLAVVVALAADENAHHQAMEVAEHSMKAIQDAAKTGDTKTIATEAMKIHNAFPAVEKFWVEKNSEVGIKAAKESIASSKVLADAASAGAPAEEVTAKLKVMGSSCRSCHTQHREKTPAGKYVFKY
ncbi:MAG TPA: hypothetical protein VE621_11760 [Bryobacteraceae bacterium]|nr:hypothetical protein [Bryobacteraceae bacterium]